MKKVILWIFQITCSGILFYTSYAKLSSKPVSVLIFTELGMEPTGRYIIGVVELCAAVLLLSERMAATGAFLALGTMLGAIIAHITVIGFDVLGDHGRHIMMWSVVFSGSLVVSIIRRRQLPLIGASMAK
ncbi:MAG: DoxX family protein [bacterium]|nr:DoxX family protein [bacterium]